MKIAVCGGGPLGIEMALHIQDWGGSFSIFSPGKLGGGTLKQDMGRPWSEVTSVLGRSLLARSGRPEWTQDSFLNKIPDYSEYRESYLLPLIQVGHLESCHRQGRVLRVHKRFLAAGEEVPGRSRLHDLFRVVFKIDEARAQTGVQEHLQEHPSLLKSLEGLTVKGQDVMASLMSPLESFEDFDMVISAMGVLHHPLPMGPGNTLAVGEERAMAHKRLFRLSPSAPIPEITTGKVALIGSGTTAALHVLKMAQALISSRLQLILITSEDQAFGRLKLPLLDSLLNQLASLQQNLDKEFRQKLAEWEELDDFVRAKVKRPVPAPSPLTIHTGANVTAADVLMDHDGLFLTLERPDFRRPAGDLSTLQTLKVDLALVACGYSIDRGPFQGLRLAFSYDGKRTLSPDGAHPEPGFFTLGPVCPGEKGSSDRYDLAQGLAQISGIKKIVFNYFSEAKEE